MKISKILFDYILAILLIIITFPIQIIISILLLIKLKEFPIFIQERGLTLSNRRFMMLKFKTIKSNIQSRNINQKFLSSINPELLTKFTFFIRKKGLDELPQLFQVLAGKMSLVGPRPLMMEDLIFMKNNYPKEYEMRNQLMDKPGITGLWQLFGNKNSGIEDLIKYDIEYNSKQSIILDFKIILTTFFYIFITQKVFDD